MAAHQQARDGRMIGGQEWRGVASSLWKFHLNFVGRKGLGRDREGRETLKGETKWIRIKDMREEWKRETSKLLRGNGMWRRRERGKMRLEKN